MSPESFTQKVIPISAKLQRFAKSLLKDEDDASDTVQDVLLKLWDRRHLMAGIENVEAWCMKMIRNRALDKIRYQSYRRSNQIETAFEIASALPSPHKSVELKQGLEQMHQAMDELPERQKAVIHLREIEGYSYDEIAVIVGTDLNTIKVELHRARKKVRDKMKSIYGNDF
ncbi:RNA polymerase sigma factor [Fulvivirgaceae bacterium LMO-SS25]